MDQSYQKLVGIYLLSILSGFAFPIYDIIEASAIPMSWKIMILIFYVATLGFSEELIRRHFKIKKVDKPLITKPEQPTVPPP